jgi:hypothetical protein
MELSANTKGKLLGKAKGQEKKEPSKTKKTRNQESQVQNEDDGSEGEGRDVNVETDSITSHVPATQEEIQIESGKKSQGEAIENSHVRIPPINDNSGARIITKRDKRRYWRFKLKQLYSQDEMIGLIEKIGEEELRKKKVKWIDVELTQKELKVAFHKGAYQTTFHYDFVEDPQPFDPPLKQLQGEIRIWSDEEEEGKKAQSEYNTLSEILNEVTQGADLGAIMKEAAMKQNQQKMHVLFQNFANLHFMVESLGKKRPSAFADQENELEFYSKMKPKFQSKAALVKQQEKFTNWKGAYELVLKKLDTEDQGKFENLLAKTHYDPLFPFYSKLNDKEDEEIQADQAILDLLKPLLQNQEFVDSLKTHLRLC